ncbi:MAG: hypothetical protein ACRDRR_00350 [Pseudonocardiaceae bacterium]
MTTTDAGNPSTASTPLELLGSHPGLSVVDPGTVLTRLWYFDGKFLRAAGFRLDQEYVRSLVALSNQATGSGVVHGFDVARASGDRLRVEGGLALAPSGRVVYLPQRVELSIAELITRSTGTFDPSSPPEPGVADFGRCPPDQPAGPDVTVPARPLYVLTVAGIEALCGEEERFGQLCEDACATETDRSKVVEGVCFRVRELTLALPTSTAVPFGNEHLRSRVASAFFELERTAVPSMISGAGLRNPVWCAAAEGIGGEEVALAVFDRSGAVTSFVDGWIARRELVETTPRRYWAQRMAMRPWDVFLAQVLQFQCQLLDLGARGTGGGIVDPCTGERDVLVAVQEVLTNLAADPGGEGDATRSRPPGAVGLLPPDVFSRVEAVRAKVTAVLGSGKRPASGSLLVDGGVVAVPAAGYLPTSLARDVAEQVRALFGPGVDLRFCAVRPDFVPEALLEAQHMERISLTRGLDDPEDLEEVDVLVPDGEVVDAPGATVSAFTGVGRILPTRDRDGANGSALSFSVVARDSTVPSTGAGWSWALAGYGEAPQQLSVPGLVRAILLEARRAFGGDLPTEGDEEGDEPTEGTEPTEVFIRPDSEHDRRRLAASFTQRLRREAGHADVRKARLLARARPFAGAASGRGEPDRPLADDEERPVAVWVDVETTVGLETLPPGSDTYARLRASVYSRAATNPVLVDVRLSGTLRVVDVVASGSHRVIRTVLDGVADVFEIGQSTLVRIPALALNWTVEGLPIGTRILAVTVGDPAFASASFTETGDPRHLEGDATFRQTIASLKLDQEDEALARGSTGRTVADSVVSIIGAELEPPGRDPAFAAYARQRLLGAVGGETTSQVRATTDWVLFHRRRTRVCAGEVVERPLRTRTYRLYHSTRDDSDLRRFEALRAGFEPAEVAVDNLGFEPVATLEFLEGQVELRTPASVLRASWQAGDRGTRLRLALVGDLGPGDGEPVALARLATVRSLLADLVDSSQAGVVYLPAVPPEFQEPGLDGVMFTVGIDEVATLGCIQVVEITIGLELTPEAQLAEAFVKGDVATVDQLVGNGVGVLGTASFTNRGPDRAAFDQLVQKVGDIVATRMPTKGTVLWLDADWSGLGGEAEAVARRAATQLLDAAEVPAETRQQPQTIDFSGSPCTARLLVVFRPKPPAQILGCVQVIDLISGLELTPEAQLTGAFDKGDTPRVDALVREGVGVVGSVNFTPEGPDAASLDQLVQKVAGLVGSRILVEGTTLWIDADWPGRGGEAENVARAVAKSLLDSAKLPAENRHEPTIVSFSGSPCATRLFVRSAFRIG